MTKLIIERLKKWIQPLPVNQVKCIYPYELQDALGLADEDLFELVNYLYNERFITYRYKFVCPSCIAECIEYERILKGGLFYCGECGCKFTFDEIKKKCEVVYEIDKKEVLCIGNKSNINFTDASMNNIIDFNSIREEIKGDMDMSKEVKKKIFFGSSTEAVDTMENIATMVGELGYQTLPWNVSGKGIFVAGDSTIDSLIEISHDVQGAIFIFNSDDDVWFRQEKKLTQTRDNVLLEYGLFVGSLGKKNVIFVCNNSPKIASDLLGVNYINAKDDDSVIKAKLKDWLKTI